MPVLKQCLTVLVVDHEALTRWSLSEVLRRGGHTVLEAQSAAAARDAIGRSSTRIDVVLLDCPSPHVHDLGLLDEMRHYLPQSPVVLMTATATADTVRGAMDRGAYCVLSKPFDMNTVEALVADAYRSSRHH